MVPGVAESIERSNQVASMGGPGGPTRCHIAGVVLLGGSVRSSDFQAAIGRSPLNLPCSAEKSLLQAWCDGIRALGLARGERFSLRILADQAAAEALGTPTAEGVEIIIGKDPLEWRGTGGVLRDISGFYGPEDYILVANASQILMRSLSDLVDALEALQADVAVLAHQDGMPSTMMLVRCGCLAELPSVGFVDMKEQAIPQLAAKYSVRVVYVPHAIALGVRTAKSYLAALREFHITAGGRASLRNEAWRSSFALVENGANVSSGARLHDSVILTGASVGQGAVVVRSVLCPGARVQPGETVVDRLVYSDGRQVPTGEAS